MVTRTSQALEVKGGQYSQVQQVGAGTVQAEGPSTLGDGGEGYRDQLIQSLLGQAGQVMQQGIQTSEEDAYLAGAAKAGQIESEEQLQSSYLTRDWSTAGYRDAMGKLKLADAEAQFGVDLKDLREKGPDELNKYLAKRRADLTPMLEGMSRNARAATFGQLLVSDRQAIAKHTVAHVDWQREVKQKSIQQSWNVALNNLDEALKTGDIEVQRKANESAAMVAVSILTDDMLTPQQKEEMTKDLVGSALGNDHVTFYTYMRNNSGNAEGGKPLLGHLSLGAQEELSKAHYAAEGRVIGRRNQQVWDTQIKYEAAFDAGTYTGTRDEVHAFATDNLRNKLWTDEQYRSFLLKHDTMARKNADKSRVTDAWLRGATNEHSALGFTGDEAGKLTLDTLDKAKVPKSAQIAMLLGAANAGSNEGFKLAGDAAGRGIMALSGPGKDGVIRQEHVDTAKATVEALASLPGGDTGVQAAQFLAAMPEEARERVMALRYYMEDGMAPELALAKRFEVEGQLASMSPQQKAGLAAKREQENNKFLHEEMTNRDFFDTVLSKVPFTGEIRQSLETILPSDSTLLGHGSRSEKVLSAYRLAARNEVAVEFQRMFTRNPLMSPKEAQAGAAAAVAARTVPTAHGPLILPRGQTPQSFFKVTDSTEAIGRAVSAKLKPATADGSFLFSASNGRLVWQEVNADGDTTGLSGTVTPDMAKVGIQEEHQAKAKAYDRASVGGITHVTSDGITLNYNGVNTASVSDRVALEFRSNLVKNEGVRVTPYKLRGTTVVGVGIAHPAYMPKPQPDGRISRADLESSFKVASNDALKIGGRVSKQLNLKDTGTLLLSEMAYQGGRFHVRPEYKEFLTAMSPAGGSADAAIAAFRKTGVYADSGPARRTHYESLITKSLKER